MPDLGAACADRCGCGIVNLVGSGGAYFSRLREDPGSGGDGRRRWPGARLAVRGRRCLGAPTCDLTGPPSDSSRAEVAPVTPGPVKRVPERCGRIVRSAGRNSKPARGGGTRGFPACGAN
ncbi:hypothetical protein NDU88_003308 [Pleurodeles waltl]|uniref:Uncharacterized protein n=1 Tax=Pleurodeles waltl TaxID=8319 RepID=A0AAV7T4W2_PLEWA|nr:hypothetical protein NDU88_003308 [Pleurodeles waltl]